MIQDADSMREASEKKSAGKALRAKKPSEIGTVEGKVKKPTSRKRKGAAVDDAGDDSDDQDSKKAKREVTAYILISSSTSGSAVRKSGPKAAASTTTIQRGPFFFHVDDTFLDFKSKLATSLPCKESLLPLDRLQWCYEKPSTDKHKPFVDGTGFKAMQASLQERKKDLVVNIHMPPPKQDDTVCAS